MNDARDTTAEAAAATDDLDARVDDVLARLTLDEKLRMLAGDLPLRDVVRMGRHYDERPYVAAAMPRLGLDGIRFTDGRDRRLGARSACSHPLGGGLPPVVPACIRTG